MRYVFNIPILSMRKPMFKKALSNITVMTKWKHWDFNPDLLFASPPLLPFTTVTCLLAALSYRSQNSDWFMFLWRHIYSFDLVWAHTSLYLFTQILFLFIKNYAWLFFIHLFIDKQHREYSQNIDIVIAYGE